MKRQENYFRLTLSISLLFFYILTPFACTPTKVQDYPREAQQGTMPPRAASERTTEKKTVPLKPAPEKTYDETVSEWKSYQDLVKWMENDFSFDKERYEKFEGTLPVPRTPQETFQLKSGIYIDVARFSKETLNRMNPSYKAQLVVLIVRPHGLNHYVCSFRKDDKLFILDYGTPYKEVTGIHGPYSSLEEYRKFYEKHRPMKGEIEAIIYLP